MGGGISRMTGFEVQVPARYKYAGLMKYYRHSEQAIDFAAMNKHLKETMAVSHSGKGMESGKAATDGMANPKKMGKITTNL